MPIRFRCSRCNRLLGIARRKAGVETKCPHCGATIMVPQDDGGDEGRTEFDDLDDLVNPISERPAQTAAPAVAARPAPPPVPRACQNGRRAISPSSGRTAALRTRRGSCARGVERFSRPYGLVETETPPHRRHGRDESGLGAKSNRHQRPEGHGTDRCGRGAHGSLVRAGFIIASR